MRISQKRILKLFPYKSGHQFTLSRAQVNKEEYNDLPWRNPAANDIGL